MLLLVALSVAACLVPAVLTDDSEQTPCLDPKVSSFKVSLRNLKNATGHWTAQVVFKQGQPGAANEWLADVDQNVITCEGQESTLETVVNLEAPHKGSAPFGSAPRWDSARSVTAHTAQPITGKEVPKDYELFLGIGYYKFHAQLLTWTEARSRCTVEGGHLIILNSQQENEVAMRIYTRHPTAGAWFMAGIMEIGVHSAWYTIFEVPLEKTGYTEFLPGRNNAPGANNYGSMHRGGKYAETTGSTRYPFICEIDL